MTTGIICVMARVRLFSTIHVLILFVLLSATARALPADFDVDAFLSQPVEVPLVQVVKWSKTGRVHDDNQKMVTELVAEFARTGDERYARAAVKIFLAYATIYEEMSRLHPSSAAGGTLHVQLLDEAQWLVYMAEAFEILDTKHAISDADRMAIVSGLLGPAVASQMRGNMPNNHQWWFNTAIGVTGFAIGNQGFIDTAIDGPRGFKYHLANQINDDGLLFEQAATYQHWALFAYTRLADAAARHGVDLWGLEVKDATERDGLNGKKSLKLMFEAAAHFPFPNGAVPTIKDTGYGGYVQRFYEDYATFFRLHYGDDTRTLSLLDHHTEAQGARDRGEVPAAVLHPNGPFALNGRSVAGSSLFPSSGYAILRANGADVNASAVNFTFGPYGGGHGHPDSLAVVLYADNEIILPDMGRYEYGDPMHAVWGKQTLAHNTVVVDKKSQKPMNIPGMSIWAETPPDDMGVLDGFLATDRVQMARAHCDTAVDGVRLDRTVALFGGALIDIFRTKTGRKRIFDYVLHVNGTYQSGNLGLAPQEKSLGKQFGYELLSNVRGADRTGPMITTWTTAGGNGLMVAAMGSGERAFVADAPGNPAAATMPLLLLRHEGEDAAFVSVIIPYTKDTALADLAVPGLLEVSYIEQTGDPAPVGVVFSSPDADNYVALSPGGALYDLNQWMQTDAALTAFSVPKSGVGEVDIFHNFRRIGHGGPLGFEADKPIHYMQISYDPGRLIRIDLETGQETKLAIGEDILYGLTRDCPALSVNFNGTSMPIGEKIDLQLKTGKSTLEFHCAQ